MTTRLVLADDHRQARSGIRTLVESVPELEVVGEAGTGGEAVSIARRRGADLVIMDVRMPGMDGLEATRLLAGPDVEEPIAVIVVTTYDLDRYVFEALQAGASGFLLKQSVPEELLPAIRAVQDGQGLIGTEVTKRLIAEYASLAPPPDPDPGLAEITDRQRQILMLVADGLTNSEIAARLVVEETTVKTHVSSLLGRLGLRNRVELAIYAFEQGLVRIGRRDAPG